MVVSATAIGMWYQGIRHSLRSAPEVGHGDPFQHADLGALVAMDVDGEPPPTCWIVQAYLTSSIQQFAYFVHISFQAGSIANFYRPCLAEHDHQNGSR